MEDLAAKLCDNGVAARLRRDAATERGDIAVRLWRGLIEQVSECAFCMTQPRG